MSFQHLIRDKKSKNLKYYAYKTIISQIKFFRKYRKEENVCKYLKIITWCNKCMHDILYIYVINQIYL